MFWVRFRSSCIIAVCTVLALVLGGNVLFGVILLVSLVGMMEMYRVVDVHRAFPGIIGYFACAAYDFLLLFGMGAYRAEFFIAFFLVLMLGYVFTFPKYHSGQVTMVFFSFFYVAVMLSYVWQLRTSDGGAYLVWLVFIGSWGSDTCAYLVGRKFGKHKIVPKLSPKKSFEGCIGGVVGAAALGALFAAVFSEKLTLFSNPVFSCALMGAASSVLSQLGDWAASAIKRNFDVKDYGTLIPGHGGIMDRFDSVIFTAPVIYYLAQFL
ncbi:MAG: phosphatidate cytidylyltransferase [Lachnospiraceae bacterium]|nr:phosphatidate cytidylyltransferase [Lachnospiraceae bacterium]